MTKQALTAKQVAEIEQRTAVSDLEMTARRLLATTRVVREWDAVENIVIRAFEASWSASLPVAKISMIGCALLGLDDSETIHLRVAKACTVLVRTGMLRSTMLRGARTYELNI